jgi:hypothetical protein
VKVKQEVPRGGSVTLEPTGVTAAMTGGCSMSLEAERGVVSDSAGKNGLIVTPAKTTLQAGDAAIDVTPASIKFFSGEVMSVDASGMVKIM